MEGKNINNFCKEVVGCVMRECIVASMYGYAHPRSKARIGSRIHRLPFTTTVAFGEPIDKGKRAQVHLSTQKGMAFIALKRCYQDLRKSSRRRNKLQRYGSRRARRSHNLCCVCLSDLGQKAKCFVEHVFLCFDNLMLEFFLKSNGCAVRTRPPQRLYLLRRLRALHVL
jgi:hypothetical protein